MILDMILVHFFSYQGFDMGKNVSIFGVDNSYSLHVVTRKKYRSSW